MFLSARIMYVKGKTQRVESMNLRLLLCLGNTDFGFSDNKDFETTF